MNPRRRVKTSLLHQEPDRVPVDFLATPEIWQQLAAAIKSHSDPTEISPYYDTSWNAVLEFLQIDCRLFSYDQFCQPPTSILHKGATIDWFGAPSRSTPNRMWRQLTPAGDYYDIWGRHTRIVEHSSGAFEEFAGNPLGSEQTISGLKGHPWPQPDWWDFTQLPRLIKDLFKDNEYHLRFRIGSVFEIAWQLRGLERFLADLAINPSFPHYIMDRLTEIHVENARAVLEQAGDEIDMLYFYDDVATQQSLMISKQMWREFIRPYHAQIIQVANDYQKQVMYHCDGAIAPLIPELIDLGIDVLNPLQIDAKGMEPLKLKEEFGDRICFHGGIDIKTTLPGGSIEDVQSEVRERIKALGANGGYILAGSHHIQSNTPIENIFAMYDTAIRNPELNLSRSVVNN